MKAVCYNQYGSPSVLHLEEVAKPTPGDNEVLVKIHTVSLNSWDWDTLTGKPLEYRFLSGFFKPRSRLIHGCDIAGTVEAVGQKIESLKVGDEVFGDLGESGWGAYAEYFCTSEANLFIKPPSMSFEEAACLSHGGNLAIQGLIDFGEIKGGQNILINGGGGSTGTLAIQIAKTFDVEITAVDNRHKLEFMQSLGADHVIDYTKEDFTRNGQQYDLIFDVKSDRSISDYQRVLAPGGIYTTVGGKTSSILPIALFGKRLKQCKMFLVGYKANKDLAYLVNLYETGKLKLFIDRQYPLNKTADAFHYFGEGHFKGKIIVTLNNGTE